MIKYSIVNPAYYAANEEEILALVIGVGSFEPTQLQGILGLRSVDVSGIANTFKVPPRLPEETTEDYVARIEPFTTAAVTQVANGVKDAVVLETDKEFLTIKKLTGFPQLPDTI